MLNLLFYFHKEVSINPKNIPAKKDPCKRASRIEI